MQASTALPIRWSVSLPSGVQVERVIQSSEHGMSLAFYGDPGFGFMVMATGDMTVVTSILRVTAVRALNGSVVECAGSSGSFTRTIQVADVGKPEY